MPDNENTPAKGSLEWFDALPENNSVSTEVTAKPAAAVKATPAKDNTFVDGNYLNASAWNARDLSTLKRATPTEGNVLGYRLNIDENGNTSRDAILSGQSRQYYRDLRRDQRKDNRLIRRFDRQQKANEALGIQASVPKFDDKAAYVLNAYAGLGKTVNSNNAIQPTSVTAEPQVTASPSYKYNLAGGIYDQEANAPWLDITKEVLNTLYNNKKFDALNMMSKDGNIDYNGILNFQRYLGSGENFGNGQFNAATLQALKNRGYITDAQLNDLNKKYSILSSAAPAAASGLKHNVTVTGVPYSQLTPEEIQAAEKAWMDPVDPTKITLQKQGGNLNMKYFQAGGAVNAQQVAAENTQEQQQQLTEIFMAIAKNPSETLQALAKQGVQPKQIIDIAQKMADSNPAAKEALVALQQMSQMAKQGAKLNYFKRLRGECPEGYEASYYKAGGRVCMKCMKKIEMEKCGGKPKKHENGGETELVANFKAMRYGGKAKKKK